MDSLHQLRIHKTPPFSQHRVYLEALQADHFPLELAVVGEGAEVAGSHQSNVIKEETL